LGLVLQVIKSAGEYVQGMEPELSKDELRRPKLLLLETD